MRRAPLTAHFGAPAVQSVQSVPVTQSACCSYFAGEYDFSWCLGRHSAKPHGRCQSSSSGPRWWRQSLALSVATRARMAEEPRSKLTPKAWIPRAPGVPLHTVYPFTPLQAVEHSANLCSLCRRRKIGQTRPLISCCSIIQACATLAFLRLHAAPFTHTILQVLRRSLCILLRYPEGYEG